MQQSAPQIAFDDCTAMLGDVVLAGAQTVTLRLAGRRFSGNLLVSPGTRTPSREEAVHLFVPGHGPAEIHVVGSPPGHALPNTLHFEVGWMSPDLLATCRGE